MFLNILKVLHTSKANAFKQKGTRTFKESESLQNQLNFWKGEAHFDIIEI